MQGIYFGKFDAIGRTSSFDAAFLPEIRRELALLAMIDPVCIPPDHLVENPLALPALESLKQLVRNGRIGTSGSAAGHSPLALLERKIDERLEEIPRRSGRREETFLLRKAEELKGRMRDLIPREFPIVRDISLQILQYSRTLADGLEEAAENLNLSEAKLLLQQAFRAFDLDQGIRTFWLISLDQLRGAINPAAWRTLLMMIQSCYFRFGEHANNCIWYPDKFWVQLRGLSVPGPLLPTTVRSDFSYENIVNTAKLLGANLEPALNLNDRKLFELFGSKEMQRFSAKLKQALLFPRPMGSLMKSLEPRKLVDVRTWLEQFDPSLDEYMAAANLAVRNQGVYLVKRWSVHGSLIMQGEIGNEAPGSRDCTYNPRTMRLRRGNQEVTLTPALGHLFMILVIHSSEGILRWYVAQEKLEAEVSRAAQQWGKKLNRIEKKILLLSKREYDEQDTYLRLISKRQERLGQILKPLGLVIQKNRYGLWSIAGGRVSVESEEETGCAEKPKLISGPPRIRRAFDILAAYYPYPVPYQEIVSFLQIRESLPERINPERKVWRDYSALNQYLKKSSHPCGVKTSPRGHYKLVCQAC